MFGCKFYILVITFIFICCCDGEKVRFDNYTLYGVFPKDEKQINLLRSLQDDTRFDFWNDPSPYKEYVNILASQENKQYLEKVLLEHGIEVNVAVDNIQELIDKERVNKYTRRNLRSMTWNAYYTLDDIYSWMEDLISSYPEATEIIGGISYEGRPIKGIRIYHGRANKKIFLEGGIHSREWISPATVAYIANELLTSPIDEIRDAAREYDWYIFPVTNPDGYIWTFTNNRMWRKNRRPINAQQTGVDLNRNWNNNWLVAGASIDPSSDTYPGPGPFSEPETRTLSTYIRSISDGMEFYLSFHSYGQLLLLPFGNTTEPLANYFEAINIGRRAMGALSVRYGTQYVTGNVAEAIYHATGGSIDWVKGHLDVRLVYCYELRPDDWRVGFILPPDEILPNNLEVMDSILELIYMSKRITAPSAAPGPGASFLFIFIVGVMLHLFKY
ncbi:Zinc carboxypeptidase A 1 [Eumeta japonica]|uniref:Zinc carboxypeptidase A 1 n=1 Tax=Eumeta variegata TaxID=151549 RepID=A0A4C1ZYJ0_EUMVA|nr:Zinc carboxypeptidase A 1 [Eumeta japonica]